MVDILTSMLKIGTAVLNPNSVERHSEKWCLHSDIWQIVILFKTQKQA